MVAHQVRPAEHAEESDLWPGYHPDTEVHGTCNVGHGPSFVRRRFLKGGAQEDHIDAHRADETKADGAGGWRAPPGAKDRLSCAESDVAGLGAARRRMRSCPTCGAPLRVCTPRFRAAGEASGACRPERGATSPTGSLGT